MPEVILIPPVEDNGRKCVAAYCRVSTTNEEQATSLELQIAHYTNKINDNPNWDFAGVYYDAKSGLKSANRKGLNELLKRCNNGEVDIILVKSVSKFGRNLYESLLTLRHLKSIGVDVWCEQENIKLLECKSESEFSLVLLFAQIESETKSENIKFGINYGLKTGTSKLYNRICYGYTHDNEGNLIVDEIEAVIVRTIFDMYLEGYSFSGISKELLCHNIKSPTGKEKWSSETISKLLSNEKLTGDVLGQKTYVEDYLSGKQVKNNGEKDKYILRNHHEPIISKELFDKVQEEKIRRSNITRTDYSTTRKSTRYSNDALSGRIMCSECGASYRRIMRSTKNGSVIVWRCANRIEYGNKICKESFTVSNEDIEEAIADKLLLYQYDEDIAKEYLEKIVIKGSVISVKVKEFNENDMLKMREYQMSRAALAGNKDALNLLYEESYKKIKCFIQQHLYNNGLSTYDRLMRDYEDICQDAFLKSFRILEKYHGKCEFSSWVTKIAHYEIGNRLKKLRRSKERLSTIDDFDIYVMYNRH